MDLEPSGRQLDFALGYEIDIGTNSTIAAKFLHTKDPNHVADAKSEDGIMFGLKYNNFHLGSSYNSKNILSAKMKYSLNF